MKRTDFSFQSIEKELDISFIKLGSLALIENSDGTVFFKPQPLFKNIKGYPFLKGVDMSTRFCKFKPNFPKIHGVYLWVVDNEIIYIGEGENLYKRFNDGYGNISPRNCFKGGQSTNVKMNQVALNLYLMGKQIEIYAFETKHHREIEKALLGKIPTLHNVKNNLSDKYLKQ